MKPLKIISDNICNRENIAFGFDAYANAIAELIATKSNKTPFTIGISGRWGAGKTTLMKRIEKILLNNIPIENNFRKIKTVWFQAWKYKNEDEILAALIHDIFEVLDAEKTIMLKTKDSIIKSAKRLPISLNYRKIFSVLSKATVNIDLTEFIKKQDDEDLTYNEFLSFYDNFEKEFDEILWELLGIKKHEEQKDEKAALVIFIDDLDRCPLPKIIQILETIKIFMDREGCIFIIGAAKDIIQEALKQEAKYGEVDAEKFLEKIVQVEFPLPQKTFENSDVFISEITSKLGVGEIIDKEDIKKILPILDFNPRRIIALFNRISLQQSIMSYNNNEINFKKILFWRVLDLYNGLFFNLIRRSPSFFANFTEDIKMFYQLPKEEKEDDNLVKTKLKDKSNIKWLKDDSLNIIFLKMNLSTEEYQQLVSYNKKFQYDEEGLKESGGIFFYSKQMEEKYFKDERDLKKLIQIPGGDYDLGEIGKRKIDSFYIGKYSVSNRWFKEFIDDKGYSNLSYWSSNGVNWLNKHAITKPDFWHDKNFNHPSQPVVGVSWYESEAFCNWLTETCFPLKYSLPTESQWLAAAKGRNVRKYAWGDNWDINYCNNWELKLDKTTVVGIFREGDTPEGVSDMIGNVWEWCIVDRSFENKLIKSPGGVVYGGSWTYNSQRCWNGQRSVNDPKKRSHNIGFRVIALEIF